MYIEYTKATLGEIIKRINGYNNRLKVENNRFGKS